MRRSIVALVAALLWGLPLSLAVGATQQAPVPRPFPGTTTPPPPAKPSAPVVRPPAVPASSGAEAPTVDPALAGVPMFPQARLLDSFDAGLGQRYYLYGTDAPYQEVVLYFRASLMSGGRELYRTPPMQQFDLGRFDENAMAYPPSVVVKDYASGGGTGYLFVSGSTEQRFRTIIQIVPPAPAR